MLIGASPSCAPVLPSTGPAGPPQAGSVRHRQCAAHMRARGIKKETNLAWPVDDDRAPIRSPVTGPGPGDSNVIGDWARHGHAPTTRPPQAQDIIMHACPQPAKTPLHYHPPSRLAGCPIPYKQGCKGKATSLRELRHVFTTQPIDRLIGGALRPVGRLGAPSAAAASPHLMS